MMFNGLLMCGDSDTSDATKESVAISASGSCASSASGARAQYYHNKLLATMQILENKEETVRVQEESLAVAETRIATLTGRIADMRNEIDRKDRELQNLRKMIDNDDKEKSTGITTTTQDSDSQKNIVSTLQNNLSVIEELYRECFYETVKQDDLIEMLRKSYMDVRLMEKEKTDEIGKLQNVIHTQKWSLERCKDVAMEVENLKLEISNFLNNSNYDSGVWERSDMSVASAVGDDLQDIMEHLLRLRDLLTGDCTRGLEEENMKLKESNDGMEQQIGELKKRISDLDATLQEKDEEDKKYKNQIAIKEKELHDIRQQLIGLEENSRDKLHACDSLSFQLQHKEELLSNKTAELARAQRNCEAKHRIIKELRKQIEKADLIVKENEKFSSDISYLRSRVCRGGDTAGRYDRRIRTLEAELADERTHCKNIHASYREKVHDVMELQSQLEVAQASGSTLCAETKHALTAVRRWAKQQRDRHMEQEERMREKDKLIDALQKRLQERERNTIGMSASETEASCSKCISNRRERSDLGICFTPKTEREQCVGTSESEMASCSSAPVPPKRMSRRKLQLYDNEHRVTVTSRDACPPGPRAAPAPSHRSQDTSCECSYCHVRHLRETAIPQALSPTSELLSYVERLGSALADCRRRWMHRTQSPNTFT